MALKNNGQVLLPNLSYYTETIHYRRLLSTDGEDENGLKLEKQKIALGQCF